MKGPSHKKLHSTLTGGEDDEEISGLDMGGTLSKKTNPQNMQH